MSKDVVELANKLRKLNETLARVAAAKSAERLISIIHQPGWTTVAESALVHGMVDMLQHQLDGFQRGQENLITITDSMGTGWSSVQPMPNQHFWLGAATTAVFPPPPVSPGGFVDGTIIVVTARLYVVGGSGQSNDMQAYQPATDTWTPAATLPTARVGLAVTVGSDHRIYAIGGRINPTGVLSNAVEAFSPAAFHFHLGPGSWTGGLASMPTARERPTAACGRDGRIYVAGGSNGSALHVSAPLQTLEIYDPVSDTWSTGANLNIARDGAAAATGADGKIYVIGGTDGNSTLSSAEVYDPATNTWTAIASMATGRESLAAAEGPDGRIYAIGGFHNSRVLSSVEVYNPVTNSWVTGPPMSTSRAQCAAAVGPDGRLYAIGGFDGIFLLNSVEALSF
jgi:N-acetylneuraminic acid mutarotase